MRAFARLALSLTLLVVTTASAQLTIPQIVQLPTEDFVWTWGTRVPGALQEAEGLRRADFNVQGFEQGFRCQLTGAFRPSSRMSDFANLRTFEEKLTTSLYFIQDSTYDLNDLYRANQIDWAKLDCHIPVTEAPADKDQERLDRAVERAQRDRERRRQREESADD